MALKKTISLTGIVNVMTEHGPIADGQKVINLNSYIRVESVTAKKSSATATVSFTDGNKFITKNYEFRPDLNGSNFIKQAYEHLKTLAEFADAADC